MSLTRFAARTMLASYFIVNGAKSVTNPAPLVADAQPIVDKAVPAAKRLAPAEVSAYIPEDTKTLVRLNGAMQVLGGLGLATGIGRRLGALMIAGAMAPHVLASNPLQGADANEKAEKRKVALRNVALMGGALLASQDLEGRPSLSWRAEQGKKSLFRSADKATRQLRKDARSASKDARKQAKALEKDLRKQSKKAGDMLADVLPA